MTKNSLRLFLALILCVTAIAADHDKIRGRDEAKFDLLKCPFMKRRKDLPFLKENWALDASGSYFLRNHPAVVAAEKNFEKHQLGIIDTGLSLNGNPAAGDRLRAASPEKDYDLHGTHVVGIAASEAYGVNPRLSVAVYPVAYRDPHDLNNMFTGAGFDSAEPIQRVKEAAKKDSGVSVINLSISSVEDPAMRAVIQEAMDNGKWEVYSSGNDTAINSRFSAGLQAFVGNPKLFSVGSMSYFGAPSSFSNFGPSVKWYAPGSAIESLNARYNPDFAEPETMLSIGGTSMAAPHFAAVLATLIG